MTPEFFDALAVVLALALGFILKRNDKVRNDAIPIINFIVQVLVRVAGQIAAPAAEAGALNDVAKFGESVLLESLIVTVVASGVHGVGKSALRFKALFESIKAVLAQRALDAAVTEAAKNQPPPAEGQ